MFNHMVRPPWSQHLAKQNRSVSDSVKSSLSKSATENRACKDGAFCGFGPNSEYFFFMHKSLDSLASIKCSISLSVQ